MKKKWSLKGKKCDFSDEGRREYEIISGYKEEDIETLREKLIEDLCGELLKDGKPFGRHDNIPQITILETINKRFGAKK